MASGLQNPVLGSLREDSPQWLSSYVLGYVRGVLSRYPHQVGEIASALGIERRTFERLREKVPEIRDDPRAWKKD